MLTCRWCNHTNYANLKCSLLIYITRIVILYFSYSGSYVIIVCLFFFYSLLFEYIFHIFFSLFLINPAVCFCFSYRWSFIFCWEIWDVLWTLSWHSRSPRRPPRSITRLLDYTTGSWWFSIIILDWWNMIDCRVGYCCVVGALSLRHRAALCASVLFK